MTAPVDDAEFVAYAAGDGWIERMPADEWAGLTLQEQTEMVWMAYFLNETERLERQRPGSEQDRLLKEVRTVWLRDLVWRAWLALPSHERDVLATLRVRFVEEALDPDTRGRCVTGWGRNRRFGPYTRIVLDPARYDQDDEDDILRTIFHELAHAGYRHSELKNWVKNPKQNATLARILEAHAQLMGRVWTMQMREQENGELTEN